MAGSVRKRNWIDAQGKERIAWEVDYRDQQRRRRTKGGFATRKAGLAWLLQMRVAARDGKLFEHDAPITVAQAGELWLRHCEVEGLEVGTMLDYESQLRSQIVPLLGKKLLAELTAAEIEDFRSALLRRVGRERALRIFATLKRVTSIARKLDYYVPDFSQIEGIKSRSRDKRQLEIGRDIPTREEVNAILAAASPRWRPLLVTAAYTGMRSSELRGLSWDCVDFNKQIIRVRQRADKTKALGATKTPAGRRLIPMAGPVLKVLREWWLAYPFDKETGLVFGSLAFAASNRGQPLGNGQPLTEIGKAQKAAGVIKATGKPKYTFHSLRHFFASVGIAAGFDPKRLQVILGHSSIKMTFDVYGHLFPTPEEDRDRMARIEEAMSNAAKMQQGRLKH
jgi:integrase